MDPTIKWFVIGFSAVSVIVAVGMALVILQDQGKFESFTKPDLAITMSASPASVSAGDELTYTYTITNAGGPAAATVLTATLPSGVTYESSVPDSPACKVNSGIVTCNMGDTGEGSTGRSTIIVKLDPSLSGTITGTATITSEEEDMDTTNNSASLDVVVQ